MEGMILIEVRDTHEKVVERFKTSALPVKIGRAYDNDVIVDDPYVCPHHCEIGQDERGRLVVKDLTSVNGLLQPNSKARVSQLVVEESSPNRQFRIGHTHLSIHFPGETIAPARIEHGASLCGVQWPPTSLLLIIPILIAAAMVMATTAYLDSYREFKFGRYFFSELIPAALGVAGWAAIWSIVSRITMHSFSFLRHATILVSILLIGSFSTLLINTLKFAFSAEAPFEYLGVGLLVATITLLIFWHLRLCSDKRPRRLLTISSAIAILIVGLIQVDDYLDNKEFRSSPSYSTLLKLPQFQITSSKDVDAFLKESASLHNTIEQEVANSSRNSKGS